MTTLGAIRSDVLAGPPNTLGDNFLFWLSLTKYTYLCPWFLDVTDRLAVTGASDTQAIVDTELEQAWRCGIDYFAYDYASQERDLYASGVGYNGDFYEHLLNINDGFLLHLASTKKSLVKACLVLGGDSNLPPIVGTDASWDTYVVPDLVAKFQDSAYMTVLSGRPLVFIFNPPVLYSVGTLGFTSSGAAATAIANLRTACAAATSPSVGNPYIMALGVSGDITSYVSTLNLDGASYYANGFDANAQGESATSFLARGEASWTTTKALYGTNTAPICVVGLNHNYVTEPRTGVGWANGGVGDHSGRGNDRNGHWSGYQTTQDNYTLPPTAAQYAAHVVAGKAWALANTTANTCILNGWQEGDVNPWIRPSHADWDVFPQTVSGASARGGSYLQSVAQSVGRQRENSRALRARGIQLKSR